MKRYLFTIVFTASCLILSARSLDGVGLYQTGEVAVSATRQAYLDKLNNIEQQLWSIDNKWNWIVATPSEDSIAKAEGWYTYMGARRDQLKADLISIKVEQLQNYYEDILNLTSGNETLKQTTIKDMEKNRLALSPNYPLHSEYIPLSEPVILSLKTWLMTYPEQYDGFTTYLEQLVTSDF